MANCIDPLNQSPLGSRGTFPAGIWELLRGSVGSGGIYLFIPLICQATQESTAQPPPGDAVSAPAVTPTLPGAPPGLHRADGRDTVQGQIPTAGAGFGALRGDRSRMMERGSGTQRGSVPAEHGAGFGALRRDRSQLSTEREGIGPGAHPGIRAPGAAGTSSGLPLPGR